MIASEFDRALEATKTLPITAVRRLLADAWIAYRTKDHDEAITRLELRLALRLGTIRPAAILDVTQ